MSDKIVHLSAYTIITEENSEHLQAIVEDMSCRVHEELPDIDCNQHYLLAMALLIEYLTVVRHSAEIEFREGEAEPEEDAGLH